MEPKECRVLTARSLLAIMLGRLEMSIPSCIDAYINLSKAIFQPRRYSASVIGRVIDKINVQERFSSSILEQAIVGLLERNGQTRDSPLQCETPTKCKIFVCATRKQTGGRVLFRSYSSGRSQGLDCTILEAARATSAAPSFFNSVSIGPLGEKFIDGAIGCNNPVREVMAEAYDIWPSELHRNLVMVSIGTGQPTVQPIGENLVDFARTAVKFATETEHTASEFARDHPELVSRYFRFSVAKGLENVGLEEYKKLATVSSVTADYLGLEEVRRALQDCARALRALE